MAASSRGKKEPKLNGRLFVAGAPHEHEGAALVGSHSAMDPVCGFCGRGPGVTVASEIACDDKMPGRMDPHAFGSDPLNEIQVKTLLDRSKKAVRAAAKLEPGSRWHHFKVMTRPEPAKVGPDDGRPEAKRAAAIFRDVLAAGENWLPTIAARLDGGDAQDAAVAASMLSLRNPAVPAWNFNPTLSPDPASLAALSAVADGAATHLRYGGAMDLEVARLALLVHALDETRAQVAEAAMDAMGDNGLPAETAVVRPWCWIDDAFRARARGALARVVARSASGALSWKAGIQAVAALASVGADDPDGLLRVAEPLMSHSEGTPGAIAYAVARAPTSLSVALLIPLAERYHTLKGGQGVVRALLRTWDPRALDWVAEHVSRETLYNTFLSINPLPGDLGHAADQFAERWRARRSDRWDPLREHLAGVREGRTRLADDAALRVWCRSGTWVRCLLPTDGPAEYAAQAGAMIAALDAAGPSDGGAGNGP